MSEPDPPRATPPPRPRWVKVSLIVAAALVVLLVAVVAIAGGEHGPGRHSGEDAGRHTPPVEHIS